MEKYPPKTEGHPHQYKNKDKHLLFHIKTYSLICQIIRKSKQETTGTTTTITRTIIVITIGMYLRVKDEYLFKCLCSIFTAPGSVYTCVCVRSAGFICVYMGHESVCASMYLQICCSTRMLTTTGKRKRKRKREVWGGGVKMKEVKKISLK